MQRKWQMLLSPFQRTLPIGVATARVYAGWQHGYMKATRHHPDRRVGAELSGISTSADASRESVEVSVFTLSAKAS